MKPILKRLIIVIATTIVVLSVCLLALQIYLEPRRNGLSMAQWLQVLKADKKSMNLPLQIIRITETEDSGVELELPLAFDVMFTNGLIDSDGILHHVQIWFEIDGGNFSASGPERATNGNCLFWASKDELHPGTNQIQAHIIIAQQKGRFPLHADGPVYNYFSTNLFFIKSSAGTLYSEGVLLYAKVMAPNAVYQIELQDTSGHHLKSFKGRPKDSLIEEYWNLRNDSGNIFTGQTVKAIYEVTVPGFPPQTIEQTHPVKSP